MNNAELTAFEKDLRKLLNKYVPQKSYVDGFGNTIKVDDAVHGEIEMSDTVEVLVDYIDELRSSDYWQWKQIILEEGE
tara:strand:+ start:791 stop:1024 length:234 start_codon:yes stop_codon:yes gene_type:complete